MHFFPLRASKMALIFKTTYKRNGDRNADIKSLRHFDTDKEINKQFNPTKSLLMKHGGAFSRLTFDRKFPSEKFPCFTHLQMAAWVDHLQPSLCSLHHCKSLSENIFQGPLSVPYLGDFPAPPIVWIPRKTGGVVRAAWRRWGADTGRRRDAGVSVDLAQLKELETSPFCSLSEEARLRGELKK